MYMTLPSSFFSTALSSFFSSLDESSLRSALCVSSVDFLSASTILSSLREVSKLVTFSSSFFSSFSLSEDSSCFCSFSLAGEFSCFSSSAFSLFPSLSSTRLWLFASTEFSSSLLAKEGSLNKNETDKAAINVALIILLLFICYPYPI